MTVYCVQLAQRFDASLGALVPKFDVEPARVFGDIKYLLSPSAAPWTPDPIIDDLHAGLAQYKDGDHLLLIGNPILIGWAVSIAADKNNGRVSCLQWSGRDRRYLQVQAQLFEDFDPAQ